MLLIIMLLIIYLKGSTIVIPFRHEIQKCCQTVWSSIWIRTGLLCFRCFYLFHAHKLLQISAAVTGFLPTIKQVRGGKSLLEAMEHYVTSSRCDLLVVPSNALSSKEAALGSVALAILKRLEVSRTIKRCFEAMLALFLACQFGDHLCSILASDPHILVIHKMIQNVWLLTSQSERDAKLSL
jgi:hypothetical protein